eukprot:Polyplicarium_translucidae@DN1255_c0_g1_i1.p1
MIQGGDPEGTGNGGHSAFEDKAPFFDEFDNRLRHVGGGIVSMANRMRKHDNRSQFFITFKSAEHLNDRHTIFGKVVGGAATLKAFEKLKTDRTDRPENPPVIQEAVVFKNPFEELAEEATAEAMPKPVEK